MVVTTIIMVVVVVVVGLVGVMIMTVGVVVGVVVVVVMIMMMMIIIRAFHKLLGNDLATSRIWNNFFLFEHFLEPVMVIMVTMVAMMMMMMMITIITTTISNNLKSTKEGIRKKVEEIIWKSFINTHLKRINSLDVCQRK